MKRRITMVAGLGLLMGGCGGAQTPDQTDVTACHDEAAAMSEAPAVCDPQKVGTFEIKVKGWQDRCQAMVDPAVTENVNAKLAESLGCTEAARVQGEKKRRCQKKVDDVVAKQSCAVGTCEAYLKELKAVVSECEIDGADVSKAKALIAPTEAKMEEEHLLAGLTRLKTECDGARALTEKDDTDGALKQIILAIANTSLKDASESEVSEIVKAKQDAFAVCKAVLEKTIDAHVKRLAKELEKPRVKKDPATWMSHFRNLEGTSSRLREVGAETIYTEATDAIDKLLLDLDKQKNRIEGKTIDNTKSTSSKVIAKGPKKCAKLLKEIKRVKGKIAEHTKANNGKKVAAYTQKLNKTESALDDLKQTLKAELGAGNMAPEKAESLKKELASAGCPL